MSRDSFKIANPVTGTTHKVILGPNGNPVSYVETQKVPDKEFAFSREHNEDQRNKVRPNTQSHMRHVGKIPWTIYAELKKRGIVDNKVKMMTWLEENRHFMVNDKPLFKPKEKKKVKPDGPSK